MRKSSRSTWEATRMLSLSNLSAGYDGFQALFEVSLEISAGEAVAVIGPNGAGKTTLLRAMSEPKLLLLDEPSAGLAPVVVQSIFELMRRICREGYTVLIVEQNIRQVLKVVSRAYLLEAGRIVLTGTSDELIQSREIQKAYL